MLARPTDQPVAGSRQAPQLFLRPVPPACTTRGSRGAFQGRTVSDGVEVPVLLGGHCRRFRRLDAQRPEDSRPVEQEPVSPAVQGLGHVAGVDAASERGAAVAGQVANFASGDAWMVVGHGQLSGAQSAGHGRRLG